MKFQKYMDIVYINKNIELQTQEFDLKTQAITRVIPDLIDYQRRFFKFIGAFTLIYGYFKARFTGVYPEQRQFPIKEQTPAKPTLVKPEVSDVAVTPANCS